MVYNKTKFSYAYLANHIFLIHYMHICISNLTIMAPTMQQAIIWTNAGILLSGPQKQIWKKF